MSLLRALDVSRQFLRKRSGTNVFMAVEHAGIELAGGTVTVLYGPSGSGKSTLLAMLAGILDPTSGRVELDGTDIYSLSDGELSRLRNRRMGVVPQGQSAVSSLTVLENVMLPAMFYKDKAAGAKAPDAYTDAAGTAAPEQRAAALLERTGIAELKDVMPRELSGGELRRMAIARAMMNDPDIVLADEPTADLDEASAASSMEIFREAAASGKAVFIVTHDRMVMDYADYIFIMRNGILERESGEEDIDHEKQKV